MTDLLVLDSPAFRLSIQPFFFILFFIICEMHTALDDSGGCLSENADKFMHLGLRGKGKVLNSACLYMSLIKQKIKLIYRAPNEISRGLSGCQ